MRRRKFIKATIGAGALIGLVGTGVWLSIEKNKQPLTVDAALNVIDKLSLDKIKHTGQWNLSQIMNHCAQSVEFSMTGFPEHKSDLFKNTIGQLAFSAFSAKGKMTHSLNEAIPGAPLLAINDDSLSAINRFKTSLIAFKNFSGTLKPHFAYGELSKQEYEKAHVMHFYNHLQEIKT